MSNESLKLNQVNRIRKKRVRRRNIFTEIFGLFANNQGHHSHKESSHSHNIGRTIRQKKRSSLNNYGHYQEPSLSTNLTSDLNSSKASRIIRRKKRSSLVNYSQYKEPVAEIASQSLLPALRLIRKKKWSKFTSLPKADRSSNSDLVNFSPLNLKFSPARILKSPIAWLVGIGSLYIALSVFPITVGGIPIPIIHKFLFDRQALSAYVSGDSKRLHDRLSVMGIEEEVKDYYRAQISNETELDRHIHQIMYERTGYVGEAYRVDEKGELQYKDNGRFNEKGELKK